MRKFQDRQFACLVMIRVVLIGVDGMRWGVMSTAMSPLSLQYESRVLARCVLRDVLAVSRG